MSLSELRADFRRRHDAVATLDAFVADQLKLADVLKSPKHEMLDAMMDEAKYRDSDEMNESHVRGYVPEARLQSYDEVAAADELREAEEAEEERMRRFASQKCRFCGGSPLNMVEQILHPLNAGIMMRMLTGYGTIKPRRATGLCAKHQRRFSRVVRRARHLGVLSHKDSTFTVHAPFADTPFQRTPEGQWMGGRNAGDNEPIFDYIELDEDEEEYDDDHLLTTEEQLAQGRELARAETRLAESSAEEQQSSLAT